MELPVSFQLRELGLALALGAALGLLYELLGLLRRGRITTTLADLAFVLTVLVCLPAFALYAGRGRLRLFALAAMALSGGLTRLGCGVFRAFFKKSAGPSSKKQKKAKKTVAFAKKPDKM